MTVVKERLVSGKFEKIYFDRYLRPVGTHTRCVPDSVREAARQRLINEGGYAECIAMLNVEPAIKSDPFALKMRGVAKLALRDYAGADEDFAVAIRLLRRELSATYCNQAASLIEQGELNEALAMARTAMEIDPNWYLPGVGLLSVLALSGEVDTAWQTLVEWLDIWPDGHRDAQLHQYLAEDGMLSALRADSRFDGLLRSNR